MSELTASEQESLLRDKRISVNHLFTRIGQYQRLRHKQYCDYWDLLKPQTTEDWLHRLQFALCTVHNSWQSSIKMYSLLQTMPLVFSISQLEKAFMDAGTGLYDRAEQLFRLTKNFRGDAFAYFPRSGESCAKFRDRLTDMIKGIARAKASFAIEMGYPDECTVVCGDRHFFRLYGYEQAPKDDVYDDVERHWFKAGPRNNVSSVMVRHMTYDDVQKESNTRYWSHVFETPEIARYADEIFGSSEESDTCQSPCDSQQQEGRVEGSAASSEAENDAEAIKLGKKRAKYEYSDSGSARKCAGKTCVPS